MIVPYEIALKLKQLGFSKETIKSWQLVPASSCNHSEQYGDSVFATLSPSNCKTRFELIPAPTVSEALQDIRERYRVICAVDVDYFDGWYYTGKYLFMGETEFKYTESFDDHPEAELSLLKQVVEYLIEKK